MAYYFLLTCPKKKCSFNNIFRCFWPVRKTEGKNCILSSWIRIMNGTQCERIVELFLSVCSYILMSQNQWNKSKVKWCFNLIFFSLLMKNVCFSSVVDLLKPYKRLQRVCECFIEKNKIARAKRENILLFWLFPLLFFIKVVLQKCRKIDLFCYSYGLHQLTVFHYYLSHSNAYFR